MRHFALVMGVLFLLLFATNGYCSGEEAAQKVTEQAAEEGKAEVKEASEAQEQAKDTAEATKERPISAEAIIPTNIFLSVIPNKAAKREPTNGAKSAIYTKFSIINLSSLQGRQDLDFRVFYTIRSRYQVQLPLHSLQ